MGNEIGVVGARELVEALSGSQITELNLDSNQIGAEGKAALEVAKPAGLTIEY
tara:strand:+ start:176 stop:334 length:159 start_codon:yes stop_codon:yes gene_type:complete